MPSWDESRRRWRGKVTLNGQSLRSDFKTKKEALDWEKDTRDKLQKVMTTAETPIDTDLETFMNRYLDYAQLHYDKKTYDNKRRVSKRLLKHLGIVHLTEITPDLIQGYLAVQARERSSAGYNEDLKHIKAAWAWGTENLKLIENCVQKIKKISYKRSASYTPSTEDMDKVLHVADTTEKVFLSCYLNTAARRSEVFAWKWSEDIDFKNKRVRLTTRKTRSGLPESEWLPMNDDLYDDLKWWWENRPIKDTPYVFVSASNRHYGKPYTTRRRFMNGLCKRAGVKTFQFHALRRYVASVLAQQHNVSILNIQRVLRHKNLSTTELYVQDINRDMTSVMSLLPGKVPNGSAQRGE